MKMGITLPICAAMYLAASGFSAAGLGLNLSPSQPRGIYRKVDEAPQQGSLVLTCLPKAVARLARARGYLKAGKCAAGVQPVIKRIAAVAGEQVEVLTSGVRIDGKLVPSSAPLAKDSGGRALVSYSGGKKLSEDEFFLLSTHQPRSWDSRYWGPIRRAQIQSVIKPLIVIE